MDTSLLMKWFWDNTTQVMFGQGAVKEHMKKFVKEHSRVVCTFGGGSIEHNGAKSDVTEALNELQCEVFWQGGIPANPEYDRLVEIAAFVKEKQPDIIIAVGGGSVVDGTKFIALAAKLEEGKDPWSIMKREFPASAYPFGTVMTLPATGSEWNEGFVISRRSQNQKLSVTTSMTYPKFSLLDPKYTMTLPVRQLRNGVYDAFVHCVDRYLTPEYQPLFTNLYLANVKELVDIGTEVIKEDSPIEYRERLIVAALFPINNLLNLGLKKDRGIHIIGHMLTAKYGIDHAASLSMITNAFYENQFEKRKENMALTAEFSFGVKEGTTEEKARAFINCVNKFMTDLGMPTKISQWKDIQIGDNDVEILTKMVMETTGNKPFGYESMITEDDVRYIFTNSL